MPKNGPVKGCCNFMINEERVKELYKMAVYDAHKERVDEQLCQFFMWDYIGKEMIKSFVTGTVIYALLVVLWGVGQMEMLEERLLKFQFADLIEKVVVLYLVFMALYLFVTLLVYSVRYASGKKRQRKYMKHMKNVQKMYKRDEQLKV